MKQQIGTLLFSGLEGFGYLLFNQILKYKMNYLKLLLKELNNKIKQEPLDFD